MAKSRLTVAGYLTQMIDISPMTQAEIAHEVGYTKPNIITMMKTGQTKIPLNKVPKFAKVLGIDPTHLLRIAMQEYMPETWDVLEPIIGQALVTENEMEVIRLIRSATDDKDPAIVSDADRRDLATWAKNLIK